MIVDTSALVAILYEEEGSTDILDVLISGPAAIPAPTLLEFLRVADRRSIELGIVAREMVTELRANGFEVLAFAESHAAIAAAANAQHGKGMARGGVLNLLDLMVYAIAKERDQPILCTGRDFISTDVAVHPASRPF